MKQTTGAVAASRPAKQAAPNPGRGSLITRARRAAATIAESAVEPLSTTIGSKPPGNRSSTHGRAWASFSTGRITSATGRKVCGPGTWFDYKALNNQPEPFRWRQGGPYGVVMARVLVTGGAGFIGSHIVDALIQHGLEPVVLDLRTPELEVEHITGDVRDPGAVQRA